jgi:hypothetical protein
MSETTTTAAVVIQLLMAHDEAVYVHEQVRFEFA